MSIATEPQHALLRAPETAETTEWVARVDALAPLVEEHRKAGEEQRFTPPVVMDALRAAGLHRMWVSREFGGGQVSVATGSAVIQALGRLDGSLAWQIAVQGAISRISDYLPEPTSRKLFQESSGLVIGGVNPAGAAEIVDGGFRLSGRWSNASGYAHADWIICTAFVTEGGERVVSAAGVPEIRMLFIPKSETQVYDTWYTIGLKGTGSNDFSVPETFVPREFTVSNTDLFASPPARPSRAHAAAYYDFGVGAPAVALGIAQDALASFKELAAAKTPTGSATGLAASHTTQEKLARLEMQVRIAELLLADAVHEVSEHGENGGESLSALVRVTAASVAEHAVAAVNGLYQLAGSSSLFAKSRLERCFRDVNSSTKHITVSSSHFETVGQYLLGGPLVYRR
ncbi:acyl-CoA dehydrogenase family protein [Actinacidiphila sp. ITFR-21]|uniref:acyl-CoA dehydrogenase family protein n=1 Tax=Actinacidiphila sp. ITFR-21 TaxID=3075199 RepID=UPI0028890D83|nr:acyl-CoA dehydrogenase family protein [Streptomyces sp. ITFR-21]WNI18883.1 acyl-CoA dehydrogenase family protein [Streptomyces sp. ITFR-21]